ncbi:MAG: hypothetical protein ACQESU_00380 [Halobacteriota archaeon]
MRTDAHYWTDAHGLNIYIDPCDKGTERCSKESISRFISGIFLQEFPDMEPANARDFGLDLADEIIISGDIKNLKESNRRI